MNKIGSLMAMAAMLGVNTPIGDYVDPDAAPKPAYDEDAAKRIREERARRKAENHLKQKKAR